MPRGLRSALAEALLTGMLVLLAGCSFEVFVRTDPVGVYRTAFDTPVQDVRILGGGASVEHGYDAWLKVSFAGDISLRHQARYRASDPGEALSAFRGFLPHDRDLKDPSGRWLCLVWTDPAPRHREGRVLLFKVGSGIYYFRAWTHP